MPEPIYEVDDAGKRFFRGHEDRICGEHHTTGARAWCFSCTTWCYPDFEMACPGCQVPELRKQLEEKIARLKEEG